MDNETNTQAGAADGRKPFTIAHITFYVEDAGDIRKEYREFPYYERENGAVERTLDPISDALDALDEIEADDKNVLINVHVTIGNFEKQKWGVFAMSKTAYSFRRLRDKLPRWFAGCRYAEEVKSENPRLA